MAFAYSSTAAARLAGLKYSLLDNWARDGFVPPTIPAGGSGSRRAYSFQDLVALRLAVRLRAEGLPVGAMRALVAYVRARGGLSSPHALAAIRGTRLMTDGSRVWEVECGFRPS